MNTDLPDLQAYEDTRNTPINKVGIRGYYHPVTLQLPNEAAQQTRGIFELTTTLAAKERGTHMSRFVALLGTESFELHPSALQTLTQNLCRDLQAEQAYANVQFDYFVKKLAPVSEVASLMNYEITLGATTQKNSTLYTYEIKVPVSTLCPCSKALSKFNAHNQRCYITLNLAHETPVDWKHLIQRMESKASGSLFSLLKRSDEKWVTEMSFETPKFVEDLVRDIALDLIKDNYKSIQIDVENIESIHNHSAIAQIMWER